MSSSSVHLCNYPRFRTETHLLALFASYPTSYTPNPFLCPPTPSILQAIHILPCHAPSHTLLTLSRPMSCRPYMWSHIRLPRLICGLTYMWTLHVYVVTYIWLTYIMSNIYYVVTYIMFAIYMALPLSPTPPLTLLFFLTRFPYGNENLRFFSISLQTQTEKDEKVGNKEKHTKRAEKGNSAPRLY